MGKYEKRVGKIWEKYCGEDTESDLRSYIFDWHPSIIRFKQEIADLQENILTAILCHQPEERDNRIALLYRRAWQYKNQYEGYEHILTERLEKFLCYFFYGIANVTDRNCEIIWNCKSKFECDDEQLDEMWETLWETYQKDECWGSDELKKEIWESEWNSPKRDARRSLHRAKQIIPASLWEEIEFRKQKMKDIIAKFQEIKENAEPDEDRPVIRFRHEDWVRPRRQGWDVLYCCSDLWEGLDHKKTLMKGNRLFEKSEFGW